MNNVKNIKNDDNCELGHNKYTRYSDITILVLFILVGACIQLINVYIYVILLLLVCEIV